MNRPAQCLALWALLTLAAACGAGCDAFAYLLVKTVGPFVPEDEHKAEYGLSGRSVVVLADLKDPLVASEFPRLAMVLADEIGKFLAEQKACGPVVSQHSVEAARRTERDFERWSVAQVGTYFNTDLVLHLELFEFRTRDNPNSNVYRGYAEAAVRIVDPETNEQVWPVLAAARIVTAEALPDAVTDEPGRQEKILIEGFAEKIARHFCTYKLSEMPLRPKVK
ncbi:MAG: hypothetical protein AMK72_00905 [Planctomycetes bacterium SM23_25]|nr:MAG: hypothetical protein AMK72_00905 [Planctomycetes bacterium SM23_25]